MGNHQTRFIVAGFVCLSALSTGCSHKPYVSKFPEPPAGECSITSFVWSCNQRPGRQRATEAQQAQVAAERGSETKAAPPASEK